MQIILEVLHTFLYTFSQMAGAIISAIPAFVEMKEAIDMMSLEHLLALALGVPPMLFAILIAIVKKVVKIK